MTPTTAPLFILYESRSGSTFLANLMTRNVHIAIPPETNLVTRILAKYPKNNIADQRDLDRVLAVVYGEKKFKDLGVPEEALRQRIETPLSVRAFLDTVLNTYRAEHFPKSRFWGIKKGNYAFHCQEILALYPNAGFIGLIRDGRAVFGSQKRSVYSATGNAFESNPYRAARKWVRMTEALREIERNHERTLILHYESLIKGPDETVENVITAFGLEACRRHDGGGEYAIPERYGDLHRNIGKNPIQNRMTAWKNELTKEEILAFESVASQTLAAEGYDPVHAHQVHSGLMRRAKHMVQDWSQCFRSTPGFHG